MGLNCVAERGYCENCLSKCSIPSKLVETPNLEQSSKVFSELTIKNKNMDNIEALKGSFHYRSSIQIAVC